MTINRTPIHSTAKERMGVQKAWLFPIVLTAIGLLIIYLGIIWEKNEATITEKARGLLPLQIKELLDSKAV